MCPVNNPVNSIVMAANVSNIDTVMVGGRILKKNGQLVGVDIQKVCEKLVKSQEKIIAGGAKKGFSQGEAIMNNVFPLNAGMAFMVWLAAMVVRSPFRKLQDAFIERATRMVQ